MADLNLTKMLINSILTASENPLSLGQLEAEYKQMENEYIPYKEFGFKSLIDFLNSCTDSVRIVYAGGTAQLLPVVLEEAKHIRELVENQKKDPHKKVAYKITQQVEDDILRLLANNPRNKIPLNQLNSAYLRAYRKPLPGPRGKLVPWLSTSNKFAVIAIDKHAKIIEPLSHIDLSKYKRSTLLSDASMSALRASVHNALSSLDRRVPSRDYARNGGSQPYTLAPVSGSTQNKSDSAYGAAGVTTQRGSGQTPTQAPSDGFCGALSSYTLAGAASSQSQSSRSTLPYQPSTMPSSCGAQPRSTPTASSAQNHAQTFGREQSQAPASSLAVDPVPVLEKVLTPENRRLLIKLMMKHPESTSVNALYRAFKYHRGEIDSKTFFDWLVSMEECLVMGTLSGRVFLRPEYRDLMTLEGQTVETAPTTTSHDNSSTAISGTEPTESLRVTIQNPPADSGSVAANGWHRVVERSCEIPSEPPRAAPGTVEQKLASASSELESAPTFAASESFSAPTLETKAAGFQVHDQRAPSYPDTIDPLYEACEGYYEKCEEEKDSEDRVLEGICGLGVTDIIDVMVMMWRRPKIPLDQLLDEFEQTFQRSIQPTDGVEALVKQLSDLGLLKLALNSDVSLPSPVQLRMFEYEATEWSDVTDCDAFWDKYSEDKILCEGVCMTGKVESYKEGGFTFVPDWSPPDHLYKRAEIFPQGNYVYCAEDHKFNAIAQYAISAAGHWLVYLTDLQRFKPCRKTQLKVGPAPPVLDVMPVGRCPPPGEKVKLKIVQVTPAMTFACIDDEEVCSVVKSKTDPNFTFRVLRWDNQRFVPRGDLARLNLDRGLTSMDSSAIGYGDNFVAGSWMGDIEDKFFIPLMELVELLETMGFREDSIHDLLLI